MKLRPWRHVVTPREDLREGKPLDAAEFAVHLDKVRDGDAPDVYTKPEQFFARTFLTKNMLELSSQVVRRLNGVTTETSSIFNLATQFGGGKTHALTLLYHLVKHGPAGKNWAGVSQILAKAGQRDVPLGNASVFVGTEFDSITGRGGNDGTPLRKTPWGEMAWQLGGEMAFALVAEHDAKAVSPGGDVLAKVLPDTPCLILMDELMNYISRNRKNGLAAQFYNFLQNLTEAVRAKSSAVLAVSIPASELEMNAEDQQDYDRITKLLDRLGKALMMSAEAETSEIIRRRLFEWDLSAVNADGKVLLDKDATKTCDEFAQWTVDHRQQIPGWFSVDDARKAFRDCYPFHPSVLSVFERKWRSVPKFQQTRGILRLLALWVSQAYKEGNEGGLSDMLITLGSAPLQDSTFRSACFEQLGERNLEVAVTTDIAGSINAHAVRLDKEGTDEIRKGRLHRKVATTIFFESNGGQGKEKHESTVPEIRLAVGEPSLDIGNVETALDGLTTTCYYLNVERAAYRFSLRENLNKRFSDRRATIQPAAASECIRREIQTLFGKNSLKISPIFFPEKSIQVSDRPALTVVVADYHQNMETEKETMALIEGVIRESGSSNRTFKSAQIWMVADSARIMREEATKYLAWEDIKIESDQLNYDESQLRQLNENAKRAHRDLRESIWRAYKFLVLLGKDNTLKVVDLGLVTSSAGSPVDLALARLQQDGDIEKGISPNFLVRNWPPALPEWSLKSVRDAFFASPQLPRLLFPEEIKETVARGVTNGQIAYAGKRGDGHYEPFIFETPLSSLDVEISEDFVILKREAAEGYRNAVVAAASGTVQPTQETGKTTTTTITTTEAKPTDPSIAPDDKGSAGQADFFKKLTWTGSVPPQKWMNFYTKVLSKYATDNSLTLRVTFDANPEAGISKERADETKSALRELGLDVDSFRSEK
ncbi:MAG: ATP-binding protein [Chthoniobacterales bacterium]|nr:ATP-binding protein [Chthoniobacterales bacterium]